MDIDEIVNLLDESAQTVNDWHSIGTILRKQGIDHPEDPLWNYVFAFEYMYVEDENRDYYKRYGPFAPWIELQESVFPPPLNTIDEHVLAEWSSILENAHHPVVCSRLADLLWVRKWGTRPDLYAKRAIDAYLEVSDGELSPLERTYCLIRALDLSKEIRDSERKALVVSSTVDACCEEFKLDDPKPGVSIRLIEALMKLPKTEIPTEVDDLLEQAISIYKDNAFIWENVIELKINRAGADKQKELKLYQINRSVEIAEKSEKGLLRMHHLEHALEIARKYGFQDVVNELRKKIQSVADEDLKLHELSAQVEISTVKIEEYLNWFVDEKGWKDSLTRFGYHGPPCGEYKQNIEEIEKRARDFPLQFLVTQSVFDENNFPIRYGRNIDENKEIALAQHETMGIRLFGTFAPIILERIRNKHGLPQLDELTDFFTTPIIPEDVSTIIAKAIYWYYEGEFDITAHLMTPRIESVFRTLVRELGLPIIREPVGTTPGSVIQLGRLLTMIQGRIDESWRRYFYNLLSNPIGINLRNRICHGLLPKAGKEDASLLIHVGCNLRLIRVATEKNNLSDHQT